MAKVTLGKTGITVEKNAFGALPIQRIGREEAVKLLRRAYSRGVTFSTRPDGIRTVRRNWGRLFRACGKRCT